jgi:hypothetical protein
MVGVVPHHLEPVPDPPPDPRLGEPGEDDPWDAPDDDLRPLRRPNWWRWVAIIVAVAMVVATPAAYALYLILR